MCNTLIWNYDKSCFYIGPKNWIIRLNTPCTNLKYPSSPPASTVLWLELNALATKWVLNPFMNFYIAKYGLRRGVGWHWVQTNIEYFIHTIYYFEIINNFLISYSFCVIYLTCKEFYFFINLLEFIILFDIILCYVIVLYPH